MARPTKPRLWLVNNEVSYGHEPSITIPRGKTVDYIPPDDVPWLTDQGIITELPPDKPADVVVAGAVAPDDEKEE